MKIKKTIGYVLIILFIVGYLAIIGTMPPFMIGVLILAMIGFSLFITLLFWLFNEAKNDN